MRSEDVQAQRNYWMSWGITLELIRDLGKLREGRVIDGPFLIASNTTLLIPRTKYGVGVRKLK